MKKLPLVFACQGHQLVGVAAVPEEQPDTGLIVIVGGPQYRVGSHRQYVQLTEAAAAGGFAAMRFDARGMGDAEGEQRSFEDISDDVAAAIDALQQAAPSVRRIGLWGLCGGATAALLYLRERDDPRISGLVLVNPWVRSEETQARTRVKHYYLRRVMEPAFWKKLLSGGVAAGAFRELLAALRTTLKSTAARRDTEPQAPLTLERRMGHGLARFQGETLLILSGNDYTAKEFLETVQIDAQWQAQLARPNVKRLDLQHADHTFSEPAEQEAVERATVDWLARLRPASSN